MGHRVVGVKRPRRRATLSGAIQLAGAKPPENDRGGVSTSLVLTLPALELRIAHNPKHARGHRLTRHAYE